MLFVVVFISKNVGLNMSNASLNFGIWILEPLIEALLKVVFIHSSALWKKSCHKCDSWIKAFVSTMMLVN
jgi:hypothetical protein